MCLVESGFFYNCDFKADKTAFLPPQKANLKGEDVKKVKKTVDNVIEDILAMMKEPSRKLVQKFILKEELVPFWKDENKKIRLGETSKKNSWALSSCQALSAMNSTNPCKSSWEMPNIC